MEAIAHSKKYLVSKSIGQNESASFFPWPRTNTEGLIEHSNCVTFLKDEMKWHFWIRWVFFLFVLGFPAAAAAYAAYAGRGYSGYPGFGLPGGIAGYPAGKYTTR